MRSSFSLAPVHSTSPHFFRVFFFFLSISLLSSTIRCWWLIVYFPVSGLESTTCKSFIVRGVERPGSGSQMISLTVTEVTASRPLSKERQKTHMHNNPQMYKYTSIVLSVTYLKLWVYTEISNPKLKITGFILAFNLSLFTTFLYTREKPSFCNLYSIYLFVQF